jgi:hypothetical protein
LFPASSIFTINRIPTRENQEATNPKSLPNAMRVYRVLSQSASLDMPFFSHIVVITVYGHVVFSPSFPAFLLSQLRCNRKSTSQVEFFRGRAAAGGGDLGVSKVLGSFTRSISLLSSLFFLPPPRKYGLKAL